MTRLRLALIGLNLVAGVVVASLVWSQANPPVCEAAPLDITLAGTWTQGAPMPTPRSELGSAVIENRIYVAGGLAGQGVPAAFEVYDIDTDTWTELAPLPVGLHHPGVAALDGRVYVTGGYPDLNFTASAGVWVYDPDTDEWTQRNGLPEPVAAHALVNVDDTLYLVGGAPGGTTLWRYDADADTWDTSLPPMPTPREHLGATALADRLYVVGGRWNGGANTGASEAYNPADETWESLPDMPTPRGGYSVASVGETIYAGGGEEFRGCTFNRAEAYDPLTETWARLPDMPRPRHGLTTQGVNGQWFIIGGATEATARTTATATGILDIFTPAVSP